MKLYRLKHKPTGLYFRPANGRSNLSEKGKIYTMKPSKMWAYWIRVVIRKWGLNEKLKPVEQKIVDHFKIDIKTGTSTWVDESFRSTDVDWEIEEVTD